MWGRKKHSSHGSCATSPSAEEHDLAPALLGDSSYFGKHAPLFLSFFFFPLLLSLLQHGHGCRSHQLTRETKICGLSGQCTNCHSVVIYQPFFFFCSWCQWHIAPRSAQLAATGLKSNRAVIPQSQCQYISSSSLFRVGGVGGVCQGKSLLLTQTLRWL